ncbi:Wzz/FepE/Etk N-terminal domain-containing protein [Marinobacter apostichopi]|uniref:Wzz/FepE/Etk N-terminal domain-containing protein n=1 Tax=Marinobacter apostichopi TaxID=3035454 RepID=UPI002573AEAC|nr:Wzz/FepE/Etk N-terminal domain-containing protein [Marinobacter sp. LA51]
MTQSENTSRARYDDEISLVELASTFLRRRRVFYVVFVVTMLAGLVYAILAPAKYEYVSLVKVAEKGSGEYLDEPSSVMAQLENHWVPELEAAYRAEHEKKLQFGVAFANPKDTGLIRLVTEATAAQAETVDRIHGELMGRLEKTQIVGVSNLRAKLNKRIESLDATVEMLQGAEDTGASMALAIEQLASLENELASIESVELLVVSRQSADPIGPAKVLIVTLAGVLGLLAGIFLAFFAEFAALVRDQMTDA